MSARDRNQQGKKPTAKSSVLASMGSNILAYYSVLLVVLSFILYANTLGHQYVFDDSVVITENRFTKKGIEGIPDLLTKDMFEGIYGEQLEVTGGRYRPLSMIMFALEYELFGPNPMAGHLINILLYALTGVVLFLLLVSMFGSTSAIPYVAGLLFVIHPIHTEVVANIKSRDEILCLLAGLGTAICFLRYVEVRRSAILVAGLICFLMALLSKETAVVMLALIPLFSWYLRKDSLKRIAMVQFLPLFAVFCGYMVLRTAMVGTIGGSDSLDVMENPFVHASFAEKYATICLILGKYITLLFFPSPLSSDYSYNQIPLVTWSNPWAVFWLITYAAMVLLAVRSLRSRNVFGLGLWLYLLPLVLTSNLIFNIGAPMGERFVYFSSVGFCLSIAAAALHFLKQDRIEQLVRHTPGLLAGAAVVLIASYQTISRNSDWYSNEALFTKDVQTVPNSAKVHYYYGNIYLNKAIREEPSEAKSAYLKTARDAFRRSIEINPAFHWSHYNLGRTYDMLGQADSAILSLNKTLELQPTHIATQGLLGKLYGMAKQDYPKAIFHLQRAIDFGDRSQANYHNLGIAYALNGSFPLAIQNLQKALAIAPNDARLHFDLAVTYQNSGDVASAEIHFRKAQSIDPSLSR